MKFYRGLVNVGKDGVVVQVQRGFKPMTFNAEKRQVQIKNAEPINPMSAAEVVILRHLHGMDSVTELYEVGEKKAMSFAAARDELERVYGEKVIEAVFGPRAAGARLPREVEDIGPEPEPEPIEVKLTEKFDDAETALDSAAA